MENHASFFVYNASAGSGKTYSLVKSFLSKILIQPQPDYFKHILAITFTNKAVSEMKSRILTILVDFAQGNFTDQAGSMVESLEIELNLERSVLKQRAQKILKYLLNNYALLSVETIDQFNHRILRTFARDLKLSTNFEVSMDTPLLLSQSVDRLIDQAGADPEITNMLLQFALQKTDEDKSWDISFDLKKSAQLIVNENDREELATLQGTSLQEFEFLQSKLKKELTLKEKHITSIASGLLQLFQDRGIQSSHFTGGYLFNFFEKIAQGQFNQNFNLGWQKKIGVENLYPKKVSESEAHAIEEVIPEILQAFETIKVEVYKVLLLQNLQKNLVPLATVHLVDLELQKIKTENNLLPIYEFNQIIHKEIKDQPAPFLYERLGERYKHFFIDEFQDTSSLQWNNLIPLIENSLSQQDPQTGSGSLMIVGDAKQSIYRWRGGLPEQFIHLYQEGNPFPFVKKKCVNLDTNFRSCRKIVEFNNEFFTFISRFFGDDSHQTLYEDGNKQKSIKSCEGYVHIDFIDDVKKEEAIELYTAKVFQRITEILARGFKPKDICVLTRKRQEGVAISEFLTDHGISVISNETLLLKNSLSVRMLLHLFQLQLFPEDEEVKMEVLEFLYEYLKVDEEYYTFLASQIGASLTSFSKKIKQFDIDLDFKKAHTLGLYENFEYFVYALKMHSQADAFVTTFMDFVFQFSKKPQHGKLEFIEYWELQKDKVSVSSHNSNDAVTVMTIHKSKGLEFPVVIFPFADLDIYKEIEPKAWFPYEDDGFEDLLISFNKDVEHFGEVGAHIYQQRRNTLELDNLNILYVALTRAKRELFILTKTQKDKETPTTFSDFFKSYLQQAHLWQDTVNSYSLGNPEEILEKIEPAIPQETTTYTVSLPEEHPIKLAYDQRYISGSDQEAALEFGTIFHELMSRIRSKDDVARILEELKEDPSFDQELVQQAGSRVNDLVYHPELRNLFDGHDEVFNEKDIVTSSGMVRPDRINIHKDGSITLIDFKTGLARHSHQEQIEHYAQVLLNMEFSIRKKLLVYLEEDGLVINKL